jgi:hypothetical protein
MKTIKQKNFQALRFKESFFVIGDFLTKTAPFGSLFWAVVLVYK